MALEIFRLIGSVLVNTEDAEKSLQNTDKNAASLGESLSKGFQAVGNFAKWVGTTAMAVGGAVVGLTESTREYRTEQGKLQTAFIDSGFAAETARTTYESLNGILGDSGQAVEAANHLALLCDNEEQLATMTEAMTGIYATFGDSLPLEGLAEAANETAKVGTVTGGLADALNWADVSMTRWSGILEDNEKAQKAFNKSVKKGESVEDAFNAALAACANEQERAALITDALSGAYQEQAYIYEDLNGDVIAANKAQDSLNNTMAMVGGILEPIVSTGKQVVAEVLEKATPTIETLAGVAIPFLTGALDTLVTWLGTTVQWFTDAYNWMKENESAATLIGIALGTLVLALAAYQIAQNAAAIATTVTTAATTAWGAAVAFLTSPITLTIAAIGALIAIVYLLVTHWDEVKEAAGKAWDYIKGVWAKVSAWFNTNVVQPVSKAFSDATAAVKKAFSDAWTGIKQAWAGVSGWFSSLGTGIKNSFKSVTDWLGGAFSKAWQAVKDVFSTGGKIFDGIKEGIASAFKNTVNAIIKGINKVIAKPFNTINDVIRKVKNTSILGVSPFSGLSTVSVPSIPELEEGAVLERGQVGLLEGNGAEAVVPLHKNKAWTQAVARDMDTAIGGASGGEVVAVLLDILAALEGFTSLGIRMDTGALVGALAKPMDRKLGQLQAAKGRA